MLRLRVPPTMPEQRGLETVPDYPEGCPTAKAIDCSSETWATLPRFVDDANLGADNNAPKPCSSPTRRQGLLAVRRQLAGGLAGRGRHEPSAHRQAHLG